MDLEDCLINGSTGTVVHLQMLRTSDPRHVTVYVKFHDPDTEKSHKNPLLLEKSCGIVCQ